MSQPRGEIASKIREAAQRRVEETQRIRQLRQERREELHEKAAEASASSPSGYIPYILIALVFLSFPLSEPVVDWVLVGCFFLLNGMWTLFFRSSSWLNWAMLVVFNFAVVRLSIIIPELPRLIKKVPPSAAAVYLGANVALSLCVYYGYVERRAPWTAPKTRQVKRSKRKDNSAAESSETLEEFAERRDRLNRLDLGASGVLLSNLVALIALGVIPLEALLHSARQIISFLR
ncbi:hypothetical protein DQ04_00691150 [Trypanosoma grayi]|uniref:hypothetical protein n=1 Tax=Trypanosoma grayi TaxID=71804 RepID=UPI0004F42A5E|nr:hypothetical protein DQ04_00691150 [Trypanosoma grayi]KEG13969.1 hypothetical protein DQ04_00691150 [Trypanosoma grayi]